MNQHDWIEQYRRGRELMEEALQHLQPPVIEGLAKGPALFVDAELASDRIRDLADARNQSVNQLVHSLGMMTVWSNLLTNARKQRHLRTIYAVSLSNLLGLKVLSEAHERKWVTDLYLRDPEAAAKNSAEVSFGSESSLKISA